MKLKTCRLEQLHRNLLILLAAAFAFSISSPVSAMSVSWKGSTAVMTNNQPFLGDWVTAYSFRSDMAFAARYMRMQMKDGTEMRFYLPQFDYLFHRWNEGEFQANIYGDGGYGAQNFQGKTGTVGVLTLDADIESRSLYAAAKAQANWVSSGPNVYQTELRLGAAPYKADFDDIASWLIVAIQNNPQLSRGLTATPMIRLFYRSFLVETGVSVQGDWMFNSMIHF